jgi:predicted enzyme related to lactoylglutathione lyase
MIKRVGCIEIPVSSMDKAGAFYENVLGLKKTYEHPVWTSFDIGETSFALAASGTKGGKMDKAKTCTSCSLCALRFTSTKPKQDVPTANSVLYLDVENLDTAYGKLKKKGVKFITKPTKQAWGRRTAIMLDPDSNLLVLTERD